MYKIGLIGTGIIVPVHINAIEKTNLFQIAAVCDVDEEKAKATALKCGCDYYTDYKKIDKSLDAVILNLPHFLHCEVTCYFLEKGVHVLVEKPMANTVAECEKMIETAKKSNKLLAVGHTQRFSPPNMMIKKFYDEGTYGKLAMTNDRNHTFYFPDTRPRWFLSKEKSGGGIGRNYGAHSLDKLFYIINDEIAEMHANCGNILNDFDVEGHAHIYLKFKNGISSTIILGGYHGFNINDTTFYFADAALKASSSHKLEIAQNGKFEEYPLDIEYTGFERQIIEFAKYIDGKESEIATGEYGKKIIETLERIYQS